MTYEQAQHLEPEAFKRLCGVRAETFSEMVVVLEEKARGKRKLGRPSKLSIPDQLLMTLQYWREYRPYFHIAQSWGVVESTAYRIIRSVEDTLIRLRLTRKAALSSRVKHLCLVPGDVSAGGDELRP